MIELRILEIYLLATRVAIEPFKKRYAVMSLVAYLVYQGWMEAVRGWVYGGGKWEVTQSGKDIVLRHSGILRLYEEEVLALPCWDEKRIFRFACNARLDLDKLLAKEGYWC